MTASRLSNTKTQDRGSARPGFVNEINDLVASIPMIDTSDPRRKAAVSPSEPGLEEARLRQQAIGVKLRHMFDEVVNEPVPDEFLEILRRADQRTGGDKA